VRVYKYLCAKFALKTVVEQRMKISEFADMNDPFELSGVAFSNPRVYDNLICLANEQKWGALCLSKDWNNPLLWSHYADKHRGLCLGFETGPKVEVLNLTYVDTVQQLSTGGFERLAETRNLPGSQTPEARRKAKEPLIRVLSTKFKKWEYENEARLIVSMEVEEAGLWFQPFGDELRLCEVIAGTRCPLARATIEAAVKSYAEPIRVFKVRLADRAFEVVEDPNGFAS
jgi:hypothetical protein